MSPAPGPSDARPLPLLTVLCGLSAVLLVSALVGIGVTGGGERYRTDPGGTTVPATVPSRPGDDPELGAAAIRDPFTAVRRGLAADPTLGGWTEVTGRWAQAAGTATVTAPGDFRSLAVLRPTRAPRIAQVTLTRAVDNAGLVVRYLDREHYALLVTVPSLRQVWLALVDGDPSHPDLLAVVPLPSRSAGVRLGVRITPTRLAVVVNGVLVQTVTEDRLANATGVGLLAPGATNAAGKQTPARARFDDLVVSLG